MRSVRTRNERKKFRSVRGDNRGMSLLELIIAVAIFSIAAVSLLQAFVTSGRINNKSNLYLEATTTAQNVMEEIKAKSFTDIAGAFNYPTATDGTCRFSFLESQIESIKTGSLKIKEVLKTESSDGSCIYTVVTGGGNASVTSTDGGSTYTLNPRTKGSNASKYYFEMTGVVCLNETFDVLVEFDGSSDTEYKKSSLSAADEKNDYEMPNIAKLNSDENGFLIRDEDWGMDAVEIWWQQANGQGDFDVVDDGVSKEERNKKLKEEILPKVKRTLTIKLKEEGGIVTATAQEHFEYTVNGNTYCSDHSGVNVSHDDGYGDTDTAFFSTKVGNTLEGLYVFYYPNYSSTTSSDTLDNIIFDNRIGNEAGMDLSFYVVKQKDEDTNTPRSTQEKNYKMSLTVKEVPSITNWKTNLGMYRAQTVLRTNLNYDISGTSGTSRTEIDQMKLTYQAMKSDGTPGQSETRNAATVLSANDLDDRESTDRIYTVKVSVYKTGAAEQNFQGVTPVATLDGAKED